MNPDLEIRNLPIPVRSQLIELLELNESWKKLMRIIPRTLEQNSYKCDLSLENKVKYSSKDFETVEEAARKYRLSCTGILLREWGTSGRVRPALGHLLYLLEKSELYKAADFISTEVLKLQKPQRPDKGPAAPIVFNSDELDDSDDKKINDLLDEINYSSDAIAAIQDYNSIKFNLDQSTQKSVPKIVVDLSPNFETAKPSFQVPLVVPRTESDLIQFSTENNVPNLSSLLTDGTSSDIPLVVQDFSSDSNVFNVPELSGLDISNSGENGSINSLSSNNVPNFSDLLSDSNQNRISRKHSSPLPSLSLDTPLPHLKYTDLEAATNNFDDTPLEQGGRFLGSGAFGKVYLAKSLLEQPVAVKKIILKDEIIEIDDAVTKQFQNEVEALSKYKHENLVALLGYSCDGLTYCLCYEYVAGGVLKDKLQRHELIWTERLYVALGTARAINYLHKAYEDSPLIHRDVKSSNILLDVTNKPKLCDFGLIKRTFTQNTSTATTIIGTSAYMSIEAFRGDISVKLDTFSFGVVLLELLTSLPPMDENRDGVDLVTHIQETHPDDIKPLLDTSAGSWLTNEVNFASKLYDIAKTCLLAKNQRPHMSVVCDSLEELIKKCL